MVPSGALGDSSPSRIRSGSDWLAWRASNAVPEKTGRLGPLFGFAPTGGDLDPCAIAKT